MKCLLSIKLSLKPVDSVSACMTYQRTNKGKKKQLTDIESLKISWNNLINIVMHFGKINIMAEGKYRC